MDRALLHWKESPFWQKSILWPSYALLLVFGLAALGIAFYCGVKAPDWLGLVLPIPIVMLVGVIVGSILLHKGRVFDTIVAGALVIAAVVAYGSGPVVAKANETESAKSFCLNIKGRMPEGEKLKMFRFYRPVYAVYTRRFIEVIMEPSALLELFRQDKQVYVVTREKEYGKIKDTFGAPIHVLERQWIDHRYVLLLSNRPGSNNQP